jgi:hypothetical protein
MTNKKLLWKGTLGEAKKHPVYSIGFEDGKAQARKEFIEMIDKLQRMDWDFEGLFWSDDGEFVKIADLKKLLEGKDEDN